VKDERLIRNAEIESAIADDILSLHLRIDDILNLKVARIVSLITCDIYRIAKIKKQPFAKYFLFFRNKDKRLTCNYFFWHFREEEKEAFRKTQIVKLLKFRLSNTKEHRAGQLSHRNIFTWNHAVGAHEEGAASAIPRQIAKQDTGKAHNYSGWYGSSMWSGLHYR